MKNRIKQQGNRVWIYCRVAHPDDMALKFQQEQMAEYARKQGWEVVGITAEQGSGLDFNRKGLKEVMEVVKAGRVDIVLAKSVCRIGRDMCRIMACVDEMDEYGVKLMTADNGELNFKPLRAVIYCRVGPEEQLRL
ncbi:recombinase family protein [Desulfosporosinus sp. BG]|uniref:recombinase family protein n=1 Tax=Desulfosporosinus sp. BG TaxID=1633135 RepID=UPI000857FA3C|nr:recombinase family protein [Desulfosporosinus sp. BG]ODA43059.1 hypothetical protein DSBG_0055 [Desulfosporosinus sp. BG]